MDENTKEVIQQLLESRRVEMAKLIEMRRKIADQAAQCDQAAFTCAGSIETLEQLLEGPIDLPTKITEGVG